MKCKLVLFLIIIVSFVACGNNTNKTKVTSAKMVKCEKVLSSNRNLTQRTFPGKMTATTDVNLSFRVAGVIEKINVKEGARVSKNQLVATMDSRDYELQLNATQAEYNAIKGEVERVVALYKEQSVSENDYDKAVNGLKAITSKLNAHKNALEDTKLKAPFDGYVQKINFDKGEAVSAGMPVLSFISSSAPEVKINIPTSEYLIRDELVAASATSTLYPDMVFDLKLIGTTHKSNVNNLYETKFSIETQKGVTFTAGMNLMVTLEYKNGDVTSETAIPFAAVFEIEGKSFVWLIEDGKTVQREVVVGDIRRDGTALVKSGVKEGDMLITAGIRSLKVGQEVKPLPQPTKSNVGNLL